MILLQKVIASKDWIAKLKETVKQLNQIIKEAEKRQHLPYSHNLKKPIKKKK